MKLLTLLLAVALASPLALAQTPASEGGAPQLRLWTNRKYPPIPNPIFVSETLLGGWSGQAWTAIDFQKLGVQQGDDDLAGVRVAGLFKPGTVVRLFHGDRRVGQARAGELIFTTEQMYGDSFLRWPEWPQKADLGLGGDWNPFPRKSTRGDKKLVKDAVAALLTKNGVRKPGNPVIGRVDQVDVDNDGAVDFLVVAKRKKAYQLVAIVTPDKDRAVSVTFSKDEDGEDSLGMVKLVDANGDGKLELLVETYGLETHAVVLYEIRADKAEGVLSF